MHDNGLIVMMNVIGIIVILSHLKPFITNRIANVVAMIMVVSKYSELALVRYGERLLSSRIIICETFNLLISLSR